MSSPIAFGNRDPYSIDNITSPPVPSSKSAHEAFSVNFHSPALDRAMASSPLASVSANAIARKRQRSADETDEMNLFRPKRQAVPFFIRFGSPNGEGGTPTSTGAAVSCTSRAASQPAPSKRDSGFHEDKKYKVTDNKQVATPALHEDSGFYEPADDDVQDMDSSPASPVLGEEPNSLTIPFVSVAAIPIREDSTARMIVEEGSLEESNIVEEPSRVDGTKSVEIPKVAGEGYVVNPVIDEVNAKSTQGFEGDYVEENHVIQNSIECGSTELPVTEAVKSGADSINVDEPTRPSSTHGENPTLTPRGKPSARPASTGPLHRVVLASVLDESPAMEANSSQSIGPNEFAVSYISSHRPAADGSDCLELLVHWASHGEDPTWEPEEQVHLGARDSVAKYWAGVEGGRVAVRPYEVFAVRDHKWVKAKSAARAPGRGKATGKGPRQSLHLRVEWLGYVEETLEPVARFSKDQPKLVERYFELLGGRPEKP